MLVNLLPGSFRLTNGIKNGSKLSFYYYRSGWTGGSVARITTYNLSAIGRSLGNFGFVAGLITDFIGLYNYSKNPNSPNAVHPAKFAVNTFFGTLGLSGIGTPASLMYFGVDLLFPGGWVGDGQNPGALSVYGDTVETYSNFTGKPFAYGNMK